MRSTSFRVAVTDEDMEQFAAMMIVHRQEMFPTWKAKQAVSFVSNILNNGKSIIALDGEQRVIGGIGYTLGTAERGFQDPHIVRVEMLYIEKRWRKSRVFQQGFHFFLQHLVRLETVQTLQFFAPVDEGLRGILTRISPIADTRHTKIGYEDEYRVELEALLQAYPLDSMKGGEHPHGKARIERQH